MPAKPQTPKTTKAGSGIDRRSLFKGAALAGAASASPAVGWGQTSPAPAPAAGPRPAAATPSAAALAAESQPPKTEPGFVPRCGGDFMVDAIKQLGIPYAPLMPGSSYRALHESLINYGGNKQPEVLTCLHEEIAVGMAQGYAKVTNKPLIVPMHGAVGIQHAAMAVYNAWCDGVPAILLGGNALDGTERRASIEWYHSVLDQGATLRDFVKWDAQPMSLPDFDESLKRGYELATTPPYGPVFLSLDNELQERGIGEGVRPRPLGAAPSAPVGDPAALAEAAKMLVAAAYPVIVPDRMSRTPVGMQAMVELAELLQCPVVDKGGRFNMPTTHYLCQTELGRTHLRQADVVLGIELTDPFGALNNTVDAVERYSEPLAGKSMKFIHISSRDLLIHSNYQNFQRFQEADLAIAGDGEASMPYLLEAVKQALAAGDRSRIDARRAKLQAAYKDMKDRARLAATYGWDASPISSARMCAELYEQIRASDWTLSVFGGGFLAGWPSRLWAIDQHYRVMNGQGGGGIGVGPPAALGAALAHRAEGRLPVAIVGDGDMLVCAGSLWTAAHHNIPILYVVFNNRAFHQELMHIQLMCNRHGRGVDRAGIGCAINTPNINLARLADAYGATGIGPISDPKDLGPAFKRAVQAVKAGGPALVEIVSQPR